MNNAVSRVSALLEDFPLKHDDSINHQKAGATPVFLNELAHELRQPLSTIESLAYYLEMTAPDDQMCRHLAHIRSMVNRANLILDQASSPHHLPL